MKANVPLHQSTVRSLIEFLTPKTNSKILLKPCHSCHSCHSFHSFHHLKQLRTDLKVAFCLKRCLLRSNSTLPVALVRQNRWYSMASRIDGTAIAKAIRQELKDEIISIQKTNPKFKPGLTIVQVGNREDSNAYVRSKGIAAEEAEIHYEHKQFPESITEPEVR